MILIAKDFLSKDPYEDTTYVAHVFEVDTEKTANDLLGEYNAHVASTMLASGITVNPNNPWVIMNVSLVCNKKLHKRILKENDYVKWLKSNYVVFEHENFGSFYL